MIRSFADLLEEFRVNAVQKVKAGRDPKHGPLRGGQYEGVTRGLLTRGLLADYDLRVVAGKVLGPDGELSDEIDCMLVHGDGEPLEFYDGKWFYPAAQVLAIVEAKATLYGAKLADAHKTLRSVMRCVPTSGEVGRELDLAYRAVVGERLPTDLWASADPDDGRARVRNELLRDAALPLRIMIGYGGYTSEFTLRAGFLRYVEDRITEAAGTAFEGLAPGDLPNLMICGQHALVKLNGLPYSMRVEGRTDWALYGSLRNRATLALLEVIWTRVSARFNLPVQAFGPDLEIETLTPLLYAAPEHVDDEPEWHYKGQVMPAASLEGVSESTDWEPATFGNAEFLVFTMLSGLGGSLSTDDDAFRSTAAEAGLSTEELTTRVTDTGLVYLSPERELVIIADEWACGLLPDGRAFAGETTSGRLQQWIAARV